MHFRDFLASKYYLTEDNTDNGEFDKDSFIRASYAQVFPNGSSKNVDNMWSSILQKSHYKLTKNSRDKTKKSVSAAKMAVNKAKAHIGNGFSEDDFSSKANLQDYIITLSDEEFNTLKNEIPSLANIEDANQLADNLDKLDAESLQVLQDKMSEMFPELVQAEPKNAENASASASTETPEEQQDFQEPQGPQNQETQSKSDNTPATQPEEDGDFDDYDPYSPYDQEPDQIEQVQTDQAQTANSNSLSAMLQSQHIDALNKSAETYGLTINSDGSLNFDDPDAIEKVFNAVSNGDDMLYNEYVLTYGDETSPLVKKLKADLEQENEVKLKTLEQREDRFKSMSDGVGMITGFGLFLDIFATVFSGKETNIFSEIAKKKAFAKTAREEFNKVVDSKFIKNDAESKHNAELDNIETEYNIKLEKIKNSKTDPTDSNIYKKKFMELTRDYQDKVKKHNEQLESVNTIVNKKSELDKTIFALTNGTADPELLQKIVVRNPDESDEEFEKRISNTDAVVKALKDQSNSMQKEVENFNNELTEISKNYKSQVRELNKDPDVLKDIQQARDSYMLKKQRLEAEKKLLVAKENERHSKYIQLLDSLEERRKKAAKNISVLCAWSSEPEETLAQELASYNKECLERAGLAGIELPPEDFPTDPEEIADVMDGGSYKKSSGNYYAKGKSKGTKPKPKKSSNYDFDFDDDDYLPPRGNNNQLSKQESPAKVSPELLKQQKLVQQLVAKGELLPMPETEKAESQAVKNQNLRTVWNEFISRGISVTNIEGYNPSMSEEDKLALLTKFKKDNPQIFGLSESAERSRSFRKFNEISAYQKRARDRNTLLKFSELLKSATERS